MLIDYFINKPQHRVTELSQQMDLQDELKRQHYQAPRRSGRPSLAAIARLTTFLVTLFEIHLII